MKILSRIADVLLATALIVFLSTEGFWVVRSFTVAFCQAILVLPALLRVDGAATAVTVATALVRIIAAAWPALRLVCQAPLTRRLWLTPLVAVMLMAITPVSLASCQSAREWILLIAASVVAATAIRRSGWLGWTVLLPILVLGRIVPGHSFAAIRVADPAYRQQLLDWCTRREGAHPVNLSVEHLMPYHGITRLDDDWILLSGEGPSSFDDRSRQQPHGICSWWVRRVAEGYELAQPSDASGNLWRGCVLDGTIWSARANFIVGARRLSGGGNVFEEVSRLRVPAEAMDFGETACDPRHGLVWVTEAIDNGIWAVNPATMSLVRYPIPGMVPFPKMRADGDLVISTTTHLITFDSDSGEILASSPAGLADVGFDVCSRDGSVATADTTGRLRIFVPDASGHYRFAWGVSLFAPRRVAFSPDCRKIAVTSADDHTVSVIDTSGRAVVRQMEAGPALRDIAATGDREFSVADTCGMTTYRW